MDGSASVLVVAVLCVLAGCNGFGGQKADTVEETVTPAPVPTVQNEPVEGISERGINAPTVAVNHRRALDNRSYTTRTRIRWQDKNGSTHDETAVHRVEAGGRRFHVTIEYDRSRSNDNLTRQELWYDGNRTLLRVQNVDGEEVHRRLGPDPAIQYPRARMISALFVRLEPREVSQTSTGDTIVRGPIEAVDELRRLPQFREENNGTMSARISPEGYVKRVAIGFQATVQGRPVDARVTIDFTNVGSTTVSEPGWAENVSSRRATSTPSD